MGCIKAIRSLLLVLFFVLASILQIGIVKAEHTVFIKTDGSIQPDTAPIMREGNNYRLTGNIEGNITIEKSHIVLDGDWFYIQNTYNRGKIAISVNSVENVTIKNFVIFTNLYGIRLCDVTNSNVVDNVVSRSELLNDYSSGISGSGDCQKVIVSGNTVINFSHGVYFRKDSRYSHTIIGNNITSNDMGICLMMSHEGTENLIQITENQITNNRFGIVTQWYGDDYYLWKPNPLEMNTQIFNNNFINNTQNFLSGHLIYDPDSANIWDKNSIGNYWSDYNGTDSNGDGIGDTPYIIDENNQDNYPLMNPVDITTIPEFPSWTILPLLLVATLLAATYKRKLHKTTVHSSY